jgi:putative ABC transport system permease protein
MALACGRLATTLLYGLEPQDATTAAAAAGVLLAVVIAAAMIPAWRASRLDPSRALRTE